MPTPAPGISFDWSLNVGHVLTVVVIFGTAAYHRWKQSIERSKDQEQQTKDLGELKGLVEKQTTVLDGVKDAQADLKREVAGVKDTGERTSETLGKVVEAVSGLQGKVDGLERQSNHTETEMRDVRQQMNGFSERVTKVETQTGMVVSLLSGDPNALSAARNLARLREQNQEGPR